MGKLIENTEFEKVEIVRGLFNRCSLIELLTIQQMQEKGQIRKLASEYQRNNSNEQNNRTIEHLQLLE